MKLQTQEKGITLIALVITIIILLILAGVTIAVLSGDNGILNKAVSAKEKQEIGLEKELIALAVTQSTIDDDNHKLGYKAFNNALKSTITDGRGREYDVNPKRNSPEYKIKYLDTNRCYKVTNKGEITEITNEEFEDTSPVAIELSVKIQADIVNEYNGEIQGEVFFSLEGQDESNNTIWSDVEKVKITTPGASNNTIIVNIPEEITKIKIAPAYATSGTVSGSEQVLPVDSEKLEANFTFEANEDTSITNSVTVEYSE